MDKDTKIIEEWPVLEEDGSFDMEKAEDEIVYILSFARYFQSNGLNNKVIELMKQAFGKNLEYMKAVQAAAEEMVQILENKDEDCGYHLNHIISDEKVYYLISSDTNRSYAYGGQYDTESEARDKALDYPDAYVEQDENSGKWYIWVLDEEHTKELQKESGLGECVGIFDSKEEAMTARCMYEYAHVEEVPKYESWAIIDNQTGKYAEKRIIPTEIQALVYLYQKIQPKAWMKYQNIKAEIDQLRKQR